jgi:hypothetical protein
MEINFRRVNSKGGALDDESVDFSSTIEEFKDSMEFVGLDFEGDNNKVDDDNDDEDKIVCPIKLAGYGKE